MVFLPCVPRTISSALPRPERLALVRTARAVSVIRLVGLRRVVSVAARDVVRVVRAAIGACCRGERARSSARVHAGLRAVWRALRVLHALRRRCIRERIHGISVRTGKGCLAACGNRGIPGLSALNQTPASTQLHLPPFAKSVGCASSANTCRSVAVWETRGRFSASSCGPWVDC